MKKTALLLIAILSFSTLIAQDMQKEKEAIKKAIQTGYVEGLQNEGDGKKIDAGIHPDFNLLGVGEKDAMWKLPIKDWKERQVKKRKSGDLPLPDEKTVTVEYEFIDITGNAAVTKIKFLVGGKQTYVDYISLYKFESGWKMVNKIFYKL